MAARHSKDKPASIRPGLVRVRPPLSTQQIIGRLEQLRDLLPAGGQRRWPIARS